MSEGNSEQQRPLKRSEILAIDNVKRIADQLRSERNDALALAQIMRERTDNAHTLLVDARALLAENEGAFELRQRIDAYLAKTTDL